MADYYQKLLSDETDSLSSRIKKFNTILDGEGEKMSESVIGQIRLVIGQSNLFINERFKQFRGLIEDCQLKRGEKEIKVEDLAGFWDMIYYQVDDLKAKYAELELLQANNWEVSPTVNDKVEPVKKILVTDNKPLIKPRKPLANTNGVVKKSTKSHPTNDTVDAKKPPPRSNIREFLKNKRKELANGGAVHGGDTTAEEKKSNEKSETMTNGQEGCKSGSSTETCSSEDEKENKN